jgi:MoxR-like ATPase
MFNVLIDYPSQEDEISIVHSSTAGNTPKLEKVISKEDIITFQKLISRIPVADNVIEYAVNLVTSTRPGKSSKDYINEWIDWGAGPRASQYLIMGAKARAALDGRPTPDIEDVKSLAIPILRHRIIPNFNAEAEGMKVDDIISQLLD